MRTTVSQPLEELLVVNQVAGPLVRELLEDLTTAGVRCRLLTGWIDRPGSSEPSFVVHRAWPLTKRPTWKRLLSWGGFTLQALGHIARNRRMPVLTMTNPPWLMLAMPLAKRLFGIRYALLVYDVYPDVLERMGKVRPGGLASRIWRALSRRAMLRAEGVITLGRHMARTLRGHLKSGDGCEIEIIPNWCDTDFIRPIAKSSNPFAQRHGLVDKFVVMYSGAFGATHDVESMIFAAETLSDKPNIQFVLIGGGTREKEVAQLIADKHPANVSLLPFQPFSELRYSLTSADCAIVCLDEGYEGVSVPSKTCYALAAGSALLAVSRPGTELTDLIEEHGCGLITPPRHPAALAQAVCRLHDEPELLAQCRQLARRVAEQHFSRRSATDRYHVFLNQALG